MALSVSDLSAASSNIPHTKLCFEPIGYIETCFKERHGTPRQGCLVPETRAVLRLRSDISPKICVEGLEEYSHVWLIFVFHLNTNTKVKTKVRPPRLAGEAAGVLATRTPHRPNPIGLSLVQLDYVDSSGALHLSGIDLVDGSPILDVKPYVSYCDAPPTPARTPPWLTSRPISRLHVSYSDSATRQLVALLPRLRLYSDLDSAQAAITGCLRLDPRSLHAKEKHGRGGGDREAGGHKSHHARPPAAADSFFGDEHQGGCGCVPDVVGAHDEAERSFTKADLQQDRGQQLPHSGQEQGRERLDSTGSPSAPTSCPHGLPEPVAASGRLNDRQAEQAEQGAPDGDGQLRRSRSCADMQSQSGTGEPQGEASGRTHKPVGEVATAPVEHVGSEGAGPTAWAEYGYCFDEVNVVWRMVSPTHAQVIKVEYWGADCRPVPPQSNRPAHTAHHGSLRGPQGGDPQGGEPQVQTGAR